MPSVLGLGDNTIDIYVDRGLEFPGGNALNFAVYARRLGASAHYMGCIGNDIFGVQIEDALAAEGVPYPRLRKTASETSWSRVRHTDNDRWFDGSRLYSSGEFPIYPDDAEYFETFDLVHTGVNGMLDDKIDTIASASHRLSYDFSDKFNDTSLSKIAPHLEVAVLSQVGGTRAHAVALAKKVAGLGAKLVVVTRGSAGAICVDAGKVFEQGIVETEVIDTLGAGDAFIATFIVTHLKGEQTQVALVQAARFAASICRQEGAFGRGRRHISDAQYQTHEAQAKE